MFDQVFEQELLKIKDAIQENYKGYKVLIVRLIFAEISCSQSSPLLLSRRELIHDCF